LIRSFYPLLAFALTTVFCFGQDRRESVISPGTSFELALAPGQNHTYSMRLERSNTALVVVRQMGVDVVVEVIDGAGRVIDSIDSPTGRNGDEIVELYANETGNYSIRVHPFDAKEPTGKYRVEFVSLHSAQQTSDLIERAEKWLARNSTSIPASGLIPAEAKLAKLDQVLQQARVLGIGEATHGSREFGDFRLSLTKRLIEKNDYRIVAIEGSESRFQYLARYIRGEVSKSPEIDKRIETGWIGRRSQRDLIEWVRTWNATHRKDQVRIVGVDAGDNRDARAILGRFIEIAYADAVFRRWQQVLTDLAAADEQHLVFGDSGIDATTKQFLLELKSMFDVDAPVLQARFGAQFGAAQEAAETLLEFADFNSNGEGAVINHSRDWYMGNRVLRSLQEAGSASKVIYWAHNAHVVHPSGSTRTAGGLLRDVLGCEYAAIALTFGQGAFVAQIPNDVQDRLATSNLPPAPKGTVESLFAGRTDGALVTWQCQVKSSPDWFNIPHRMHWIGGLYKPGTNPTEAFRPFMLLSDFDGVAYLPAVTADELPNDRPLVPARKR
jgi:erythromycin esterase